MWRRSRASCHFYTSREILREITRKLTHKFGFSARHAGLMTLFVLRQATSVDVVSVITASRDPDDDHILAAAIDGECAEIVTGDLDLLALRGFRGIRIVTPREFFDAVAER
jgi:uncharacterized protein